MKNSYYYAIGGSIVLILFLWVVSKRTNVIEGEDLSVFVSMIALCVAIFKIGKSDKPLNKFQGRMAVWKKEDSTTSLLYERIIIEIKNRSKADLRSAVLNIHLPKDRIVVDVTNNRVSSFTSGDYCEVRDESHTLIRNSEEAESRFEYYLYLKEWKRGKFEINLEAEGFEVTHYSLDVSLIKLIDLESNSKRKLVFRSTDRAWRWSDVPKELK